MTELRHAWLHMVLPPSTVLPSPCFPARPPGTGSQPARELAGVAARVAPTSLDPQIIVDFSLAIGALEQSGAHV